MFLIFSISRFKYSKDYIDISIKKKEKKIGHMAFNFTNKEKFKFFLIKLTNFFRSININFFFYHNIEVKHLSLC